ncbi:MULTISPECIES: fimbrillin family protein [Parabacteroides]|uniref:fimbrillin family protein n=1 Tax=Parabacteroides provencensis TaxID=1944636 RepID=UPI000C160FE1|nr:fimbrillin family protein [Parabacteroides provencensis]
MNGKVFIGIVALYMGCIACSDDSGSKYTDRYKRTVSLQVGVYPQTRACLSSLDGQRVAFAKGDAPSAYTETWEAIAQTPETSLDGEYIYPEDRSYLYLRGYYPVVPLSDGRAVYRLDGQTDLLATVERKGSFIDNFTLADKTFYFYHLLTQCAFNIRLTNTANGEIRLKSLYINGSRGEASLRLAEAATDKLPEVSFNGDQARLPVYVEPGRNEGIVLSEEARRLPLPVLVEPGAELTLDVELTFSGNETKAYKGLPVSFDEADKKSRPGTAYLITVQLHPSDTSGTGDISLGVSVTPWQSGTGNGTVQ